MQKSHFTRSAVRGRRLADDDIIFEKQFCNKQKPRKVIKTEIVEADDSCNGNTETNVSNCLEADGHSSKNDAENVFTIFSDDKSPPPAELEKKERPVAVVTVEKRGNGQCPFCSKNRGTNNGIFRIRYDCTNCCGVCGFWSKSENKVAAHKNKEHKFRAHKNKEHKFRAHKNKEHKFRCEQCRMDFRNEEDQRIHKYRKHKPRNICSVCNRSFKDYRTYLGHRTSQLHKACLDAEMRGVHYVKTELGLPIETKTDKISECRGIPKIIADNPDKGGFIWRMSEVADLVKKAVALKPWKIPSSTHGELTWGSTYYPNVAVHVDVDDPNVDEKKKEEDENIIRIPVASEETVANNCGLFQNSIFPEYTPRSAAAMEALFFSAETCTTDEIRVFGGEDVDGEVIGSVLQIPETRDAKMFLKEASEVSKEKVREMGDVTADYRPNRYEMTDTAQISGLSRVVQYEENILVCGEQFGISNNEGVLEKLEDGELRCGWGEGNGLEMIDLAGGDWNYAANMFENYLKNSVEL